MKNFRTPLGMSFFGRFQLLNQVLFFSAFLPSLSALVYVLYLFGIKTYRCCWLHRFCPPAQSLLEGRMRPSMQKQQETARGSFSAFLHCLRLVFSPSLSFFTLLYCYAFSPWSYLFLYSFHCSRALFASSSLIVETLSLVILLNNQTTFFSENVAV